jgi:formylglycine-generating enzyme required for sulfatase activity
MGWQGARQASIAVVGALVLTAAIAAPSGQEITVTLPGNVPLVFVRIPAGTFSMGSPTGERNRGDDEIQHKVTLTRDYYMGKYEVTQAQWQAIMGSDPSYFSSGDDHPVEQISWNDITGTDGFLAKLNRHLARTGQPGAGQMRLPTEAEWERAARGGTTTRFSYGDALECKDVCKPCATHSRYMWWCGDHPGRPAPVGGKQPNHYGVFDMHGNVSEWVQDRYAPYSSSVQTDPTGPSRGADRVVRGGGSEVPLEYSRSAARRVRPPDDRWAHTGLRLAFSP